MAPRSTPHEDSSKKVAEALGMKFGPPHFIVFFPKDIEEDLAGKERDFRKRKESEIYSTTFRVEKKDGKWTIYVADQSPRKKEPVEKK